MANTVNIQKVIDGKGTVVVHCYLACDGSSGELTDQILIDVSTLTPVPGDLALVSVEGCFVGFSGRLEWDATTDIPVAVLPADHPFLFTFNGTPIPDNAGSGTTGDLLLTTAGFTAATDIGHITITARKKDYTA